MREGNQTEVDCGENEKRKAKFKLSRHSIQEFGDEIPNTANVMLLSL
jgi:hypothetical protein